MTEMLYTLSESNIDFPPVEHALSDPNGLLAIGGNLSPRRLINAYKHGIFPWYSPNDPLMWWSPDPRAVIYVDNIRVNRTLRKFLNKNLYSVTINNAFNDVIENCADEDFRDDGTWIVDDMMFAYKELHMLGFAHSIEVWQGEVLVGGLYGIAINGYFSGESMFYRTPNASKVALISLGKLFKKHNISFIDCQILNPFLEDMGAINISRNKFIELKNAMLNREIDSNLWQARTLNDIF